VGSIAAISARRALPLILLLALGLRLVNLGGRSLWYDEAFAVLFAEKGLDAMLYGTLTPVNGGAADIHPLLYYLTLNGWMALFGQSPFAVRLWSVVLGVASVGMMYVLGRDLFGEKTGLAAASITALAPFHIQYSQETRMYALMGLLLMAATWCFVRAWRATIAGRENNPSQTLAVAVFLQWRWWSAFGVLAALAMYTQQLSAFYLAALGLVPVLTRQRRPLVGVILGAVVALVIYLPWLVNLPSQFNKVRSYYWIETPDLGEILGTLFSFLVVNIDIPRIALVPALTGAFFLVAFLAVQTTLHLRRAQPDRQALLFTLWLAAAPIVLMWLVSQIQPLYLPRALLPSALMLYLALAWMFTRSRLPGPIAGAIGFIAIILVGIGLYYHYNWATFPNSPVQQAVAYARESWQHGDVIVHQNKLTALPAIYYDRALTQRYLRDTPGSSEDTLALPTQEALGLVADACIQSASRGGERIWFVVLSAAESQYEAAGRAEYRQTVDWLESHFEEIERQQFNDLALILLANPQDNLPLDCE
jgi:uncharacterized membrane protein